MTSIAKLKDRARKHEQREDWKAAIEAYQQVLEAEQSEAELELLDEDELDDEELEEDELEAMSPEA